MFITLTYRDNVIPRCQAFYHEDTNTYSIKDDTRRFRKYKDLYRQHICDIDTSTSDLEMLKTKVSNDRLPYLCKKDLQLFIKRLRKHLSKYTNERIRYYACGEYGPQHFRPHFHLLVWFDRTETFKAFNRCLYSAWRFGRISSEVSRGSCSKYVAQYLNSNSCLPKVFSSDKSKPFCCHSSRLGEESLHKSKEEVYQLPFNEFIRRSLALNGIVQDVFLWRSVESWYFPQCRNYARESLGGKWYAYTLYSVAKKWTDEISPYRQAKFIVQYVYEYGFTHFVEEYQRLLLWFTQNQRFSTKKIARCDKDMFEQMFRSIYHDLYISKHFLYNVCDSKLYGHYPTHEEISNKIAIIDKHYKDKEYHGLCRQYEYTEMLLTSNMYEDEEVVFSDDWHMPKKSHVIPYLYDNVKYDLKNFNETPLPRMFIADVTERSYNSVKHKELNDLNDCFKNL
jgi:hypothetical protein